VGQILRRVFIIGETVFGLSGYVLWNTVSLHATIYNQLKKNLMCETKNFCESSLGLAKGLKSTKLQNYIRIITFS
jgi:hypothetical protein